MQILTFPIVRYFLKYQGLQQPKDHVGNTKRFIWEKKRCIEELDCASSDTKLNYSDLARKYELKGEKGAHLFL